ncbi:hypothetical protein B0H10DRAFT_1946794 [Mycena sp. CBHHK59/15]|nr:hypothetical protein B0H10DRAFT_1946794 [Mycena sp. CBHHK59/15]
MDPESHGVAPMEVDAIPLRPQNSQDSSSSKSEVDLIGPDRETVQLLHEQLARIPKLAERSKDEIAYVLATEWSLTMQNSMLATMVSEMSRHITSLSPYGSGPDSMIERNRLVKLWQATQHKDNGLAIFLHKMWKKKPQREGMPVEDQPTLHMLRIGFALHLHSRFAADDYVGDASAHFLEYLTRIIPLIGSSGMGKSKLGMAIAHSATVTKGDRVVGFDTRKVQCEIVELAVSRRQEGRARRRARRVDNDTPITTYFNNNKNEKSKFRNEEVAAAFLGAFMSVAAAELPEETSGSPDNAQAMAKHIAQLVYDTWVLLLPDHDTFPDSVEALYTQSSRFQLFKRVAISAEATLLSSGHVIDATGLTETECPRLWEAYCQSPAASLAAKLPSIKCLFLFDEFADLPSTYPLALRRIMEAGHASASNTWYLVLGTNARVQELVPTSSPDAMKDSARFATLKSLPPWCYFGFDQMAKDYAPSTPMEAAQLESLKKFGRPLWSIYLNKESLPRNALRKLFPPSSYDHLSPTHLLALFAHRILLELGSTPSAQMLRFDSVKSNLRVAQGVHGTTLKSLCPSEPILSIVSARALCRSPDTYKSSLEHLCSQLSKNNLDRGLEGELLSRLLLMRARDQGQDWSQDAVPLVLLREFLNSLVGLDNLHDNNGSKALNLVRFSQRWHINFTHFVPLKVNVSELHPEYLLSLWIRGAAVQCAPNQPVIDGFFVVYGGELDKMFDLEKFSVVAWQTEARSNAATSTILSSLSCPRITAAPKAQYVVLFMDLMTSATIKRKGSNNFWNIENTVEVTFRKAAQPKTLWDGYAKTEPEGWCINARNILAKTYPCLEGVEAVFDLLRKATILEAKSTELAQAQTLALYPLSYPSYDVVEVEGGQMESESAEAPTKRRKT